MTAAGTLPPHGEEFLPGPNQWVSLPTAPLGGRAAPAAVWTGGEMIVWGGYYGGRDKADGAAFKIAVG